MKLRKTTLGIIGLLATTLSYADSDISSRINQLQAQINQLQTQVNGSQNSNFVMDDSSNPLGAFGGQNFAYSVLQQQAQYEAPLTIGAAFSAAVQAWGGDKLTGIVGHSSHYPQSGTAVAATTANLSALANVNDWTQAFVTIQGGLNGYDTIIPEAFINFGQLNKSRIYATVGMTDLPFGTFPGNGLVASSLEANAFEPNELNQFDLGYSKGNFNTVFALFNGQNSLNDFVYSAAYTLNHNNVSLTGGAGYMYDVRYSGSSVGAAYGTSNSIYNVRTGILQGGRNGAVDLNAGATYNISNNQSLFTQAEWITTTSSPTVLHQPTGKLQAWSLTGGYTTPIFQKNTTFAIDYSATINMKSVPLQLPGAINQTSISIFGVENQWLAYFQSEILNNVYVGPEFAWMDLYNGEHTWESAVDVSVYM